ncbi:hypothetical protein ml_54 [Mollivirus sibericum]|uniref:hypothetical protein n=1 Tax=Mollivirus sibericum TaxID=1678078 RepID=UPI0006B2E2D9|nr:hypothetical protein ml_54 [Mollivirus sibericum]ALD61856.1 hypothetical protein ml_54 [Mollivirus sibericum]
MDGRTNESACPQPLSAHPLMQPKKDKKRALHTWDEGGSTCRPRFVETKQQHQRAALSFRRKKLVLEPATKRAKTTNKSMEPSPPPALPAPPQQCTDTKKEDKAEAPQAQPSPPSPPATRDDPTKSEWDANMNVYLANAVRMGARDMEGGPEDIRQHLVNFALSLLVDIYGYEKQGEDDDVAIFICPGGAVIRALVALSDQLLNGKIAQSRMEGGLTALEQDPVWTLWRDIVPWLPSLDLAQLIAAACSMPR